MSGEPGYEDMPSICNRYTTAAWEIDDFVSRYPDALVIFPAGDRIGEDTETIASPATCKNCLTIGTTLTWKAAMNTSTSPNSGLATPGCREQDCPHDVDKGDTCGTLANVNLTDVPECCYQRTDAEGWDQRSVHWNSGRGGAVSQQAPFTVFGGKTYTDIAALRFKRFKPDLVAPGVGIISARSDGDPNSGGTKGCRCAPFPRPDELIFVVLFGDVFNTSLSFPLFMRWAPEEEFKRLLPAFSTGAARPRTKTATPLP